MNELAPGRLVVISGPSGSGKTTLLAELVRRCPLPLATSVSATTRAPRPGEVDGRHYHFLPPDEFARLRDAGEFLECFEVHGRGTWYGTLRREVAPSLAAGKWVILEIDVQGMQAVVRQYPRAITLWVHAGEPSELERRLRGRGTETEAEIERRLASARREWAHAGEYQHHILNDDVGRAVDEICAVLAAAAREEQAAGSRPAPS